MRLLFVATLVVFFGCVDSLAVLGYSRRLSATKTRLINTALQAQKFDPDTFIKISAQKPLGLSLVEVEENKSRGVLVDEVKDGSVKTIGTVSKGLYLIEVNGKDVRYLDFDSIMDTIIDAPADKPVDMVFVSPNDVMKGPAQLSVLTMDGKPVKINALKGQILRNVLQDAGVEVYKGKAKITNCGGAGNCGTCVVSVQDNEFWEKRPSFEAQRLKKYDKTARLSCNTIIEGDCTVIVGPGKIQE